eukprot:3290774-Rhodomonas_salina.8
MPHIHVCLSLCNGRRACSTAGRACQKVGVQVGEEGAYEGEAEVLALLVKEHADGGQLRGGAARALHAAACVVDRRPHPCARRRHSPARTERERERQRERHAQRQREGESVGPRRVQLEALDGKQSAERGGRRTGWRCWRSREGRRPAGTPAPLSLPAAPLPP